MNNNNNRKSLLFLFLIFFCCTKHLFSAERKQEFVSQSAKELTSILGFLRIHKRIKNDLCYHMLTSHYKGKKEDEERFAAFAAINQ